MNINEYLMGFDRNFEKNGMMSVPHILCKDGFQISVQAGAWAYCEPRQDQGPWESVECGFPNRKDEDIFPYAENQKDPTGTVYPYVPVALIEMLIAKHGGAVIDPHDS